MSENKRFTVDYDITVGNYCLHDDCEAKGVDGYIAYLSDEERANNLCDLLNGQEEEIQRLKKENEKYRQILLDFGVRTVFKENTVLKDGDVE